MKIECEKSEKCDCCRRFMTPKPGCSWAQSWSDSIYYGPDLHEPKWRCAICTEKYGRIEGNCAPGFDGIIEATTDDITPMININDEQTTHDAREVEANLIRSILADASQQMVSTEWLLKIKLHKIMSVGIMKSKEIIK